MSMTQEEEGLVVNSIKPYPLTGVWTTPSDVPVGVRVIDDGVVKISRYVFNNDGTDYADGGRPPWAVNNLRPTIDEFNVCFCGVLDALSVNYALSFGADDASSSNQQFSISFHSGLCKVRIGGVNLDTKTYSLGDYISLCIYVKTDGFTVICDDDVYESFTIGSFTGTTNLYIGGRTDGVSSNFEGLTWDVGFFKGDGSVLEFFKLNESEGLVYNGTNGTILNITDGSPQSVHLKALVPL